MNAENETLARASRANCTSLSVQVLQYHDKEIESSRNSNINIHTLYILIGRSSTVEPHIAADENKQHPNATTTAIELEQTYALPARRTGSLILVLAARGGSGTAVGIAQLCVHAPARVITQAGAPFVCLLW